MRRSHEKALGPRGPVGGVFVHGPGSLPANSFSSVRPTPRFRCMQSWGSTAAPTTAPAPGWFADPHDPSMLRWWDGTAWTEHRAPGWQAPQAAPGSDHELDWLLPVNRDGFAIVAGYLGLLSLIPNPITSIAAIICGIAAVELDQADRQAGPWSGVGRAHHRRALAGRVLARGHQRQRKFELIVVRIGTFGMWLPSFAGVDSSRPGACST